jgi:hypothetical protein
VRLESEWDVDIVSYPMDTMNRAGRNEFPPDVLAGATLSGNEYGWTPDAFPKALQKAESHGLACLGGQFQFRVTDGIYEMYWLESNSTERRASESWADYSHRSCAEVREGFGKLLKDKDFVSEALKWPLFKAEISDGFDPLSSLVFVAYFITESEG